MQFVYRKKYNSKIIQCADSGKFVVAYLDLGTWYVFTPAFYIEIRPSSGVGRFWMMLKFFIFTLICLQESVVSRKPCDSLEILLMKANGSGNGGLACAHLYAYS